jgi:hypothetical protein
LPELLDEFVIDSLILDDGQGGCEVLQVQEPDMQAFVALGVRLGDILGHHEIRVPRVLPSKCEHSFSVEAIGGPFAFDCRWLLSRSYPNEIHFMSALVAPVGYLPEGKADMQLIEDPMLPQRPKVLLPKLPPPAITAAESGIESIYLGCGNNLSWPVGAERSDDMSHMGCFQDG